MFVAISTRTMAGAKRIVPDTGFQPWVSKARPPCVEARRIVLPRLLAVNAVRPHTPLQRIIDLVARMHGVSYAAVMSNSRYRIVVQARFAAICAVYQAHPDMTLPRIAKRFGRDHTSILHALRSRGVRYVPADRRQGTTGDAR